MSRKLQNFANRNWFTSFICHWSTMTMGLFLVAVTIAQFTVGVFPELRKFDPIYESNGHKENIFSMESQKVSEDETIAAAMDSVGVSGVTVQEIQEVTKQENHKPMENLGLIQNKKMPYPWMIAFILMIIGILVVSSYYRKAYNFQRIVYVRRLFNIRKPLLGIGMIVLAFAGIALVLAKVGNVLMYFDFGPFAMALTIEAAIFIKCSIFFAIATGWMYGLLEHLEFGVFMRRMMDHDKLSPKEQEIAEEVIEALQANNILKGQVFNDLKVSIVDVVAYMPKSTRKKTIQMMIAGAVSSKQSK